jgi:hypothetical protein
VDIKPHNVISILKERRLRSAPKMDCQNERPFFVVRTKASDVRESIRHAADEARIRSRERIEDAVQIDRKLWSPVQTAHFLRALADHVEREGSAS